MLVTSWTAVKDDLSCHSLEPKVASSALARIFFRFQLEPPLLDGQPVVVVVDRRNKKNVREMRVRGERKTEREKEKEKSESYSERQERQGESERDDEKKGEEEKKGEGTVD